MVWMNLTIVSIAEGESSSGIFHVNDTKCCAVRLVEYIAIVDMTVNIESSFASYRVSEHRQFSRTNLFHGLFMLILPNIGYAHEPILFMIREGEVTWELGVDSAHWPQICNPRNFGSWGQSIIFKAGANRIRISNRGSACQRFIAAVGTEYPKITYNYVSPQRFLLLVSGHFPLFFGITGSDACRYESAKEHKGDDPFKGVFFFLEAAFLMACDGRCAMFIVPKKGLQGFFIGCRVAAFGLVTIVFQDELLSFIENACAAHGSFGVSAPGNGRAKERRSCSGCYTAIRIPPHRAGDTTLKASNIVARPPPFFPASFLVASRSRAIASSRASSFLARANLVRHAPRLQEATAEGHAAPAAAIQGMAICMVHDRQARSLGGPSPWAVDRCEWPLCAKNAPSLKKLDRYFGRVLRHR